MRRQLTRGSPNTCVTLLLRSALKPVVFGNQNEGGYEPVDNEVVYLILKDISWKSEDHEIESDDATLTESE
jgi:hypothetical protein